MSTSVHSSFAVKLVSTSASLSLNGTPASESYLKTYFLFVPAFKKEKPIIFRTKKGETVKEMVLANLHLQLVSCVPVSS